jgi:hypothetical protein
MAMINGYIFLCSDATEDECLKRKLLGGTSSYLKYVKDLRTGDFLYLYNFNSKRLHGPFVAVGVAGTELVPLAWGGQYPVQVKFRIPHKRLPLSRDHLMGLLKFNKKGFPSPKVDGAQIKQLQELFQSEHRHREYDDSAALVTLDGHKVRSEAERKIDDWLFLHNMAHAYEYPIPETKRCDFYLPHSNIYIEYWGLKDARYESNKKLKIEIYKRNNLRLLELFPRDIKNLDTLMKKELVQTKIE